MKRLFSNNFKLPSQTEIATPDVHSCVSYVPSSLENSAERRHLGRTKADHIFPNALEHLFCIESDQVNGNTSTFLLTEISKREAGLS